MYILFWCAKHSTRRTCSSFSVRCRYARPYFRFFFNFFYGVALYLAPSTQFSVLLSICPHTARTPVLILHTHTCPHTIHTHLPREIDGMVLYLAPGAARLRKNEKKLKKILLKAPRVCANTQSYQGSIRALLRLYSC